MVVNKRLSGEVGVEVVGGWYGDGGGRLGNVCGLRLFLVKRLRLFSRSCVRRWLRVFAIGVVSVVLVVGSQEVGTEVVVDCSGIGGGCWNCCWGRVLRSRLTKRLRALIRSCFIFSLSGILLVGG